MSSETYVVIVTLLCIIAYLLAVIDADRVIAEKQLWECQNPINPFKKSGGQQKKMKKNIKSIRINDLK